ncbi:MAG: NAD(P)H-dependent oxidoreductase, partial [Dysgonomonas sp.]
ELSKYPEKFTIHQLYNLYPDEKIDVLKEQKLIEAHDKLILQFPMYWFNCPPLLKKWLDVVFTYGWAYGSKGNMLKGKKVALGIGKNAFIKGAFNRKVIDQYLVIAIFIVYKDVIYRFLRIVSDTVHNSLYKVGGGDS